MEDNNLEIVVNSLETKINDLSRRVIEAESRATVDERLADATTSLLAMAKRSKEQNECLFLSLNAFRAIKRCLCNINVKALPKKEEVFVLEAFEVVNEIIKHIESSDVTPEVQ